MPDLTPATILALRRRLGLTQVQLAERIGCSAIAVSYWETGHRRPQGLYAKAVRDLMATTGKGARTMTITLQHIDQSGNLIQETHGLDVDATLNAYDNAVETAVRARFPDADISWTRDWTLAGFFIDDPTKEWGENDEMCDIIRELIIAVQNDDGWYVSA